MQVQRVLETCLYVEDLAAAEQFYAKSWGWSVSPELASPQIWNLD